MPSEVCQNLIESMPRRIKAVIKANGGHTKYYRQKTALMSGHFVFLIKKWLLIGITWFLVCYEAKIIYFCGQNFQMVCSCHHCIPNQSFKNKQTLGQFFEPLYMSFIAENQSCSTCIWKNLDPVLLIFSSRTQFSVASWWAAWWRKSVILFLISDISFRSYLSGQPAN